MQISQFEHVKVKFIFTHLYTALFEEANSIIIGRALKERISGRIRWYHMMCNRSYSALSVATDIATIEDTLRKHVSGIQKGEYFFTII